MGIMMIAGTERRRQGCSLQDGKQWGASGYAVTFPIAFNVVYNVLSIPQTTASTSNAYWGRFYITALTKNGFNVSDTGAGSNRWIAIGSAQPQWGKILGDTVNLKIINFPVSFNECFGGLALFNGDPVAAAEYATITDITNTNFKIYMYANNAGTSYANANIFYLFLGAQQQWGTAGGSATFAVPFTNVLNIVCASNNSENINCQVTSINNNGFSTNRSYQCKWLAIGI